jgi:predicted CXXCH cytochrome family protein
MTKPIAEAKVVGDFRPGTELHQYGRSYAMEEHDGRYFITVTKGDHPPEKFEVNYTLGARRFQGYLSKLPDGRIYVLPVFWHQTANRWLDYKEITPIPDDPDHDLRQIWNVTCVNCHATNLVKNYDPATDRYATTWTEMGIGCESCHGPGQAHIAAAEGWRTDPSSKPADPKQWAIFSPARFTPRQTFDACGYCHGNKNNYFFGFKPGDRYEDYALPFLISEPLPPNDPQGEFWPDGRPSRFNRPQAITLTGCFSKGEATCTSCHRMHGSANDHMLKVPVEAPGGGHTAQSDQLCTQCHVTGQAGRAGPAGRAGEAGQAGEAGKALQAPRAIPDLAAHTHHAPDSQGSRCIACHMSNVNWRLITRRLDHTFQPPVPEMTAAYGVPNACTTCHEDKSPEWAARQMDAWDGNAARRRAVVKMADVIYRAGTGDTGALPEIARLAVDRSKGILIRASAAEFAGQLLLREQAGAASAAQPDPATVNALMGAAADPEPQVRALAVQALGRVHDQRALPAIGARLTDPARVVRTMAAEALLDLGVARLEGVAGQALERAQDEWAASLAAFNDVAADETTLGWLEASRGRTDQAVHTLATAIRLNPSDARPHLYMGVVKARLGAFDEALQQFKTAKTLAPSYQNLDLLISEAQKRASGRY